MNITRPTIQIAGSTILAALAVIFQILPPIYVTPWSMRIDLVAIPWILCWMIFGLKPAILSVLISAPLVGFIGPIAGGWVGAVMKSVASIWMFFIPALFSWKVGGTKQLLTNKKFFLIASILSIFIRAIITVIFNFYFALPFFFYMSAKDIIDLFSQATIFGLSGLGAYIAEVSIWNTVQAIIDLVASLSIGLIILRRLPELNIKNK
jgi:riboflavin transporter FmnP